jgi:hypothetical protein
MIDIETPSEVRDGLLFTEVHGAHYRSRMLQGATCVGRGEGGVAYRKGDALVSYELTGDGESYRMLVCPNYFLMVQT